MSACACVWLYHVWGYCETVRATLPAAALGRAWELQPHVRSLLLRPAGAGLSGARTEALTKLVVAARWCVRACTGPVHAPCTVGATAWHARVARSTHSPCLALLCAWWARAHLGSPPLAATLLLPGASYRRTPIPPRALCCRFFAPEALFEIWAMMRPAIAAASRGHFDAFDAFGWAVLFAPTQGISRCGARVPWCARCLPRSSLAARTRTPEAPHTMRAAALRASSVWRVRRRQSACVPRALPPCMTRVRCCPHGHRCDPAALNALVAQCVAELDRVALCPSWLALGLSLLARAAKDDSKGACRWNVLP